MGVSWLLLSFRGRINRQTFWLGYVLPFGVPSAVLSLYLERTLGDDHPFLWLVLLPTIWVSLAAQTKRWHDRGKSGLWNLLNFIPLAILWALIETGFFRGTAGPNQYGVEPRGFL